MMRPLSPPSVPCGFSWLALCVCVCVRVIFGLDALSQRRCATTPNAHFAPMGMCRAARVCLVSLALACCASEVRGTGRLFLRGPEATETKAVLADQKNGKTRYFDPWVYVAKGAGASVGGIGPVWTRLYNETAVVEAGLRRCKTHCKYERLSWRRKYNEAMREPGLHVMLPFRSVGGAAVHQLPIESLDLIKTYRRLVARSYVDDDAWTPGRRWVFADLGARYFLREPKAEKNDLEKRLFGSTYDFMCGYPGAERFEAHAFDIDEGHRARYPPWVRWHPYAVWDSNGTIDVVGRGAGTRGVGHAASAGSASSSSSSAASDSSDGSSGGGGGGDAVRQVATIDLADWLIRTTRADDFVVVKMDIEHAEFRVFERLYQTGALELVDEVFLECHGTLDAEAYRLGPKAWVAAELAKGNKQARTAYIPPAWVRSVACLRLERRLRTSGIYVHEWD